MPVGCDAATLLTVLQDAARETRDADALGARVVAAIRDAMPQAGWVGIYWLQGRELVLGPYVGPATEHTRIPVGRGVCGTAVAEDRDLRIADVREIENYLSCSAAVRSELVVLIRSGDRVVGQLDLDSDEVDAFGENDACVLRAVADGLGALIDRPAAPSGDDLREE
jgi:L-methionine (R)-S-oxide reductase